MAAERLPDKQNQLWRNDWWCCGSGSPGLTGRRDAP